MKRQNPEPPRLPGRHEHDVERSLAGEEGREAEEITGANLDMDEEFGRESGSESTRMEESSPDDQAEDLDRETEDAEAADADEPA